MKNIIKSLFVLVVLLTNTEANAQSFSMTPHLDAIELSTGIKSTQLENQNKDQFEYKWDGEAPVIVSIGVLAVCITIVVLATQAASANQTDTNREQYPPLR